MCSHELSQLSGKMMKNDFKLVQTCVKLKHAPARQSCTVSSHFGNLSSEKVSIIVTHQ